MRKFGVIVVVLVLTTSNCFAFGSKFKKEVEKEAGGVKLVREVISGGYDVISTVELQKLLKSGEDVLVVSISVTY